MTICDRLTVACTGFLAVAVTIVALSPIRQGKQPSDAPRTGAELCQEVAYELNQQQARQMVTAQEAERIISRCYLFYSNDRQS